MIKATSIITTVAGILLVASGIATWYTVSTTLDEQNIVTPDDACLPEREVNGPATAFCQADIINTHTLDATDGKTYAELDREDPLRQTAMTSSFLQASLFTSVVAFGVAAMAIGIGIVFVFLGLVVWKMAPAKMASEEMVPEADPA